MTVQEESFLLRVPAYILTCCLLASWVAADPTPSKRNLLPTLRRQPMASKSAAYYLAADEDWRPSGVPQISVLMAEQPLYFHVESMGSKVGLQSAWLLFKCSSSDFGFNEAPLEDTVQNSTHCQPLRPFRLDQVSESLYQLTLLRENQVPFEQALRHSMEFRLRLSFDQGMLESASLFVFNFDALSKIPKNQISSDYRKSCQACPAAKIQRTLTEFVSLDAYPYVYSQDYVDLQWIRNENRQAQIQLLRKEFVSVIQLAGPMVRNLLSLSLYYSRNCSDFREPPVVVANSGIGRIVGRSSFKPIDGFLLDADSGILHVNMPAIHAIYRELMKMQGSLDVCLNISAKGELWPYYLTFRVQKTINFFSRAARKAYNRTRQRKVPSVPMTTPFPCYFIDGKFSSSIQLPANMFNLSLTCPISCYGNVKISIDFDGTHCSRASSNDAMSDRPPCSRFFSVSQSPCDIKLIGPTSWMHTGNYTISAGAVTHTYHVSVVSLPVFTPDSMDAMTMDFNPKSVPAPLNCTVTHSGIDRVDIVPQFRLIEKFKPGIQWTQVSPHVFSSKVLDGDPRGIVLSSNRTDNRSYLGVRLESKKEEGWWVSWKVAFECSASVIRCDAQLFGLREYRVQATWNLVPNKDLWAIQQDLNLQSSPAALQHSLTLSLRLTLVFVFTICTMRSGVVSSWAERL